MTARETRIGLINGIACYFWWGLVPLYFHTVSRVPALGVLAQRICWSLVFLLLVMTIQRQWGELGRVLRSGRMMGPLAVAGVLVGINWGVFIYAVEQQEVLQSSLGYFINPLVSVMLGMIFLRERLRPAQWLGVILAAIGVLYLALHGGVFPWISLTLAFSFGFYGLLRKLVPVGPVVGLVVEAAVLTPPAVGLLLFSPQAGWPQIDLGMQGLLALSGVVTVLPLIWFVAAARRLRLSTMGFLQYIGPSLQFLIAVLVFGEPLQPQMLLTFACIWTALVIYTVDSIHAHRAPARVVEMVE